MLGPRKHKIAKEYSQTRTFEKSKYRLKSVQARNQLGTPREAKSFLREAQIFYTMCSRFELRPKHFFRGDEKFSRGICPPWLWA